MSCNIRIPIQQIIDDVVDALSGRYITTDNPFLNEAVLTDTTLRGDITADTKARDALCAILQNCGVTAEELEWLDRPTAVGQIAVSTDAGAIWQNLADILSANNVARSYRTKDEITGLDAWEGGIVSVVDDSPENNGYYEVVGGSLERVEYDPVRLARLYTDQEVLTAKVDTAIVVTSKNGSEEQSLADVLGGVVTVMAYGVDSASEDNSAAFKDAMEKSPSGSMLYLGDGTGVYKISDFGGILDADYTGSAVLVTGEETFYLGDKWQDVENTIYVAPNGSTANSGLSESAPRDLTTGFNLLKKYAAINPNVKWKLKILGSTHANGPSRRLEDFPTTKHPVIFEGAEEEGSNAVPTTIFSGWTTGIFRCLKSNGLNLIFRNLKFVDGTAEQIYIRGSGNTIWFENIHGANVTNAVVTCRGGFAEFHGGVVDNCRHGVIFQQVYGSVGDSETLPASKFTNNTGMAVQISRGSICYVNRCEFENNDVHIHQSRHSRVRTQSNTFGSFTTAAIYHETAFCLWNNNPAELDTFTTIPFGKSPLIQVAGSHVSSTSKSSELSAHLQYIGEAVNITGTARIEPENQLSPFRLPAFWLKSRTAQARVEYEIALPIAETVTIEITGENSASVLASITLNPTTFSRALVSFEFTGATRPSSTKGRYSAIARGDNINAASFGDTYALTDSAVTGNSVNEMRYRLYVKRSVGTGDMIIYRMRSFVAY